MLLLSIGGPILLLFIWTLVVRTFPEVLGEALVKRIQFGYDVELEETKAELQESLATLKSSVDFLSSMKSELRKKEIESAEILWKAVIAVKDEFRDIVYLHSILHPKEVNSLLRKDDSGSLESVQDYRNRKFMIDKLERISILPVEETRLFVGDRLWYRFFVLRAFHGRLGVLMRQSFENESVC